MPIIRNPFRKNPGDVIHEDYGRQSSSTADLNADSHGAQPLSIKANGDKTTPTEYKLCEINDSGVFLPPSPTEKPKFWTSRSYGSTTSSSHRSILNENEPFNISRESFESYRRSFDISARSPVLDPEAQRARQSLDARRLRLPPSAYKDKQINPPEAQPEERFEDVGLDDNGAANANSTSTKPRKQGIFSRFGHSSSSSDGHINAPANADAAQQRPTSSHFGGQLFGRRRGTSGQGAELGSWSGDAKDLTAQQQQNNPQPQTPEISSDR